MVRIDLRRLDACGLVVHESHPSFAAVPLLAHFFSIGKLDLNRHWKNEIAFARNDNLVAIKIRPPGLFVQGFGADSGHFIIKRLRAIDRLIEIPTQVFSAHLLDRLQKIFASGMSEPVAHKVDMHCLPQFFFADDAFQCLQHSGRFVVSDHTVRIAIHELPTPAHQWVLARQRKIENALVAKLAHVHAQQIVQDRSIFAIDIVQHFFAVAIDALIQPRIFEFIGGHHAVPILMAKFMFNHYFRKKQETTRRPSHRVSRDKGWIFHSAGSPVSGIDHCKRVVRIWPKPAIKMVQRLLDDIEMALGLACVLLLQQQLDFYLMSRSCPPQIIHLNKSGIGSPGKIVDIFHPVLMGHCAIAIRLGRNLFAAGPNNIFFGRSQLYVEDAKVGKEFGVRMKLMAIPCIVPPHSNFGKPLPA